MQNRFLLTIRKKTMSKIRDDFSDATRKIIKRQAGGHCSKCGVKTTEHSGLGAKPLTTGEAAHIEASSEGGPRYNPEDTSEYRRSAKNGVWLCNQCHTLVDNDDTNRFDAYSLFEYKADQTRKISEKILLSKKPSDDVEKAFWAIDSYGAYDGSTFDITLYKKEIEQVLIFGDEWKFQSKKLNKLMTFIQQCDHENALLKRYLSAMNDYSKTEEIDSVNKAIAIKTSEKVA